VCLEAYFIGDNAQQIAIDYAKAGATYAIPAALMIKLGANEQSASPAFLSLGGK